MKEITVTTKLKVFSIKDVFEVKKHIEERGYFANSEEEFSGISTCNKKLKEYFDPS